MAPLYVFRAQEMAVAPAAESVTSASLLRVRELPMSMVSSGSCWSAVKSMPPGEQ